MNKNILILTMILCLIAFWATRNSQKNTSQPDASQTQNQPKSLTAQEIKSTLPSEQKNSTNTARRITISESSKEELAEKKALFQKAIKAIIPEFKINGNLEEIILELKQSSGLDIELVSARTAGYSFDDNFKPLDESTFTKKAFNFDFENMPVGEIIRYLAIASGLKFKIDEERQEAIIAEKGIILNDDFKTQKINKETIRKLLSSLQGPNGNASIEDVKSLTISQMRKYIHLMGVKLHAGSDLLYDGGQIFIKVTESEQKRLNTIISALDNVH
jgi:hypothetical protein